MTYSELREEKPFDWNEALANPPEEKEARENLEWRAGSWVTCACGNQCAAIPRAEDGEPCDRELMNLGCDFSCHIDEADWENAKKVLAEIEARSVVLLREINGVSVI